MVFTRSTVVGYVAEPLLGTGLADLLGLTSLNRRAAAAARERAGDDRHRLEAMAAEGGRAALGGTHELSLMLAGAQLGITLCNLGLGALAEPAVAALLDIPLLALGLPSGVSHAIAFGISLALVVFLHMVVGEMARSPSRFCRAEEHRAAGGPDGS
ncbi:MAG TPA: CNNM domain-containing protein [Actinokineospora sp.]|jgi:CBS domain containing-hemolysin-like protein|nr:CNNM domain-containing protein [Actinokineospora sp.]